MDPDNVEAGLFSYTTGKKEQIGRESRGEQDCGIELADSGQSTTTSLFVESNTTRRQVLEEDGHLHEGRFSLSPPRGGRLIERSPSSDPGFHSDGWAYCHEKELGFSMFLERYAYLRTRGINVLVCARTTFSSMRAHTTSSTDKPQNRVLHGSSLLSSVPGTANRT